MSDFDRIPALLDTPAYCDRKDPLYLFFADRPIFSVTLVNGARREVLSVDTDTPWQHQPYSLRLTLPPLSVVVLAPPT